MLFILVNANFIAQDPLGLLLYRVLSRYSRRLQNSPHESSINCCMADDNPNFVFEGSHKIHFSCDFRQTNFGRIYFELGKT